MSPAGEPKILYTTADVSPQSGAFHSLLNMSKEIVNWGYRPVLALPEESAGGVAGGAANHAPAHFVPLARLGRSRSPAQHLRYFTRSARSAYELARIIRRERVALVHINEILDVYGAVAARIARVPCVCHLRADLSATPSILQALLPRIMVSFSSQIIAVSGSAYQHTFPNHGTPKVVVIHNPGPNPSAFHPGVDGAAVRRELGLAYDAFLIALVAKLGRRKGHEVLIRAAPKVLASFPTARFLLVGGDLEGAHHRRYADRLRQLPNELGVDHAVMFMGYRRDIPEVMAAADVVAHCSTYPDPFPGVVLQGMAVGRAVIASDLGGPREQIESGVSGVLTPPGDPSALAEAICSLLGDPEKRASLGRAAALRVRSVFTEESFYKRLSEVYQRLIADA